MAIEMNQKRIVARYEDVLFEAQGKTVSAHVEQCWKGENGESITFF